MSFEIFARMVAHHVDQMAKDDLFVGGLDGDEVYDSYLTYFPPGENEVYRERAAHDCGSCKQFIRTAGNLVNIKGGRVTTIWDVAALPYPYDVVAASLSESIKMHAPTQLFKTTLAKAGVHHNFEVLGGGDVKKWNHLHCNTFGHSTCSDPDAAVGVAAGNTSVIYRGLKEISLEAVDTVLGLISESDLVRGAQHLKSIQKFREAKIQFSQLDGYGRNLFALENHTNTALRIRNTSIGTLLVALSEGAELESAVAAYERIVAPENYRRSSALITKSMIGKAMEKIESLGLTEALQRRAATIDDIPTSHVIWTDRPDEIRRPGSLVDALMQEAKPAKARKMVGIQEIGVQEFLTTILPGAKKLEILFEKTNANKLVSLTTAAHEDTPSLFSWGSPVAWSYKGDVADSIRERVKRAGGEVDGYDHVSLGWDNTDDLDLHIIEPNGAHIYHEDRTPGRSCGKLDVDMNVSSPLRTDPVENVFWTRMAPGQYTVKVHNYQLRNREDTGFELVMEIGGQRRQFNYPLALPHEAWVEAITFTISHDGSLQDLSPNSKMREGLQQAQEWGLNTEEFYPIKLMTTSPNHWGDRPAGNKHWFFLVDECRNPDPIRGIYNEYLRSDLQEHRKVFEVLGAKTKADVSAMQLNGFGFSETVKASCVIKVDGRPYRVLFAQNEGESNV